MADYVHGKMDINQQKQMYATFWSWCVYTGLSIVVVVLLMYIFLT